MYGLYAKYEKSYLNKLMKTKFHHLIGQQRTKLHKLFLKTEWLFNGMLGTWKIDPAYVKLKLISKLMCLRLYPVPKLYEDRLKKELEWLVLLVVIEKTNYSEWWGPYFAQHKSKTN